MSTTLRYFPAIKEEFGNIRSAVKLQNIPFSERLECTIVPIMMSAANTSDEIAAAAVVRGIENPCKKTSYVNIHITCPDIIIMISATVCVTAITLIGFLL